MTGMSQDATHQLLRDQLHDSFELLKIVRPLFSLDIPWEVADGSNVVSTKIAIENIGALIKVCVQEIPIHMRMEHFDTSEGLFFLMDDLRPLLLTLQDLVRDDVVETTEYATISTGKTKLWKLDALAKIICRSVDNVLDLRACLNYLHLKQEVGYLRKVLTNVMDFNNRLVREMGKSESKTPEAVRAATTLAPVPTSDEVVLWLQTDHSPHFWDSPRKLFDALVQHLGSCSLSTHSAMLNLQGLQPPGQKDEHVEFNLLLPSCPTQGSWQETSCRVFSKGSCRGNDSDTNPGDFCEAVQLAKEYEAMINIRVHEQSFQMEYSTEQQPAYPKALPTMNVSELIERGFLRGMLGFPLKDRWVLALKLAQSLLQFDDGPWLQTVWTSEALFFLCESPEGVSKLCNIHNPFITCLISEDPPAIPIISHFDQYPVILTFGHFLLELAIGVKLPIERTKQGAFSPYKTLKNNFNAANRGSLSDHYIAAIDGCLNFHKYIRDHKDVHEGARRRMTIYQRIVVPLESNIRLFGALTTFTCRDIIVRSDVPIEATPKTPPVLSQDTGQKESPGTPQDANAYTIGIICALKREAIAVQSAFDHFFLGKANKVKRAAGDKNYYSFGTLVGHHVVLAHMGKIGGFEATDVASNMKRSFPSIKLCLVVGICGILPQIQGQETLLGDVIISTRVNHYDRGKEYPSGFHAINTLGEALPEIQRVLSGLATPRPLKDFCLELKSNLANLVKHKDLLELGYSYPGCNEDYLYDPRYRHEHHNYKCTACCTNDYCKIAVDANCKDLACSLDKVVPRERLQKLVKDPYASYIARRETNGRVSHATLPRSFAAPKVWFGEVASGEKVMKNGVMRDQIAQEHAVIAFEMEGAGIWNVFPTIVIKAGCDYADSHKNKVWQDWAAMTAAACAKAFLGHL